MYTETKYVHTCGTEKKFHKFCIFSDGSEISAHMCLLGAHHKISFLEKTRQVYIFRIANYYLFGYFIKQVIYLKPNIKQIWAKKSKFCWFFGKIDKKKVSFFTKMNVRNGHLIASLSYLYQIRTICMCICSRKKICLMYDVMTSGTYFWNIVKKRFFLEKSVSLDAHTFWDNFLWQKY